LIAWSGEAQIDAFRADSLGTVMLTCEAVAVFGGDMGVPLRAVAQYVAFRSVLDTPGI
jgi:hypothetical protein